MHSKGNHKQDERQLSEWEKIIASESETEVAQSCPTLSDPMDCSLPGSSVHGILQTIVLEWIAIPFSRGSSRPGDWTWVSCIVDRRFTVWATREVLFNLRRFHLIMSLISQIEFVNVCRNLNIQKQSILTRHIWILTA